MSYFLISLLFGLFIGLALSVDAFMLSLVYGVTIKTRREAFMTSFFVGVFHLLMPFVGYFITIFILDNVFSISSFQSKMEHFGIYILFFIGLLMIFKKDDHDTYSFKNIISKLLFAFSVSIDSFFIGIALTTIDHMNMFIIAFVFFIVSGFLTFIAIRLVNKTKKLLFIKDLNVIAGIILIVFAFISLMISIN